jgi:L-threonylcarbamoyladenylate synthase
MKTEVLRADHPVAFKHALDVLTNGGLVAFPTDTVYGLAVIPGDAQSIERLYVVKGRSNERIVAILLSSIEDLPSVAQNVTPQVKRLAESFWPGPLTIVVEGLPALPANLILDGHVGIRVPNHPIALQLLHQTGPLAVTSANLTGQPYATTSQEVLAQLDGRVHLVIEGGPLPSGLLSSVVDCTGDELIVLRQGPLSQEQLMLAINR